MTVCVWSVKVDYFNNKIICDLVEAARTGIMAQLDEACYMVGKVDDKMFLDSMSSKLASHKHFTSRKVTLLSYTLTCPFPPLFPLPSPPPVKFPPSVDAEIMLRWRQTSVKPLARLKLFTE